MTDRLLPQEFPSAWACAWGQDDFGLWQAFEINGVRQVMRWITPGEFLMGSPDDEPERYENELLHSVRLTKGFWLADSACTQALWQAVKGDNPARFDENPENPVEQVSWLDCQQFIEKANQMVGPGLALRFPTEAEWEYACRAGSRTVFSWGDRLSTQQANYNGDYPYDDGDKGVYRKKTLPVIEFDPNAWGLYQMHGNVWEWCADWYGDYAAGQVTDPAGPLEGRERVLRGGSWFSNGHELRSAGRGAFEPDYRYGIIGFRLAGG